MTSVVDAPVADPPRPARRVGGRGPLGVLRTLLSRAAWLLVVVWAAVSLTFVLSRVVPADPARLAAGLNAGPEQVAQVRHDLGLDKPTWQQYLEYIGGVARLDLGDSVQTRRPVLDDIMLFLPATLELVIYAFLIYTLVGVGLGVLWAVLPRGPHSWLINAGSVVSAALPVFWVGLVLQLVFGTQLNLFPVSGSLDYDEYGVPLATGASTLDALLAGNLPAFGSALTHLALPVTALVVSQFAIGARLTRSSVREQLRQPYVRTARARGLSTSRVVVKDVLRNALNPVITMLGLQFGWLLGGTILVEVVFSWPGLGLYAYNAFRTFDYNPILAITLVVTITFVLVNELVGLIYPILDPRLREKA
jgi:peptide/nickel transport system permease protein